MTPATTFFTELRDRLVDYRHAKQRADRPSAPAFSVFDYIRPDENRLSDILADLLDPTGPHAQGAVFVRQFLEHAGIHFDLRAEDFDQVRITREDLTTQLLANRRIDLTLDI